MIVYTWYTPFISSRQLRAYDLLALVPVLTQTLFALVRSHLVALLFLSVRHNFE